MLARCGRAWLLQLLLLALILGIPLLGWSGLDGALCSRHLPLLVVLGQVRVWKDGSLVDRVLEFEFLAALPCDDIERSGGRWGVRRPVLDSLRGLLCSIYDLVFVIGVGCRWGYLLVSGGRSCRHTVPTFLGSLGPWTICLSPADDLLLMVTLVGVFPDVVSLPNFHGITVDG